ncbi:MAG: helix-hairpin-helix domain-containing protein [Flavobacteriales bacterium]|nr:helix-hairpin-helix domain-containing protein [Flavobacteriales bacterium]
MKRLAASAIGAALILGARAQVDGVPRDVIEQRIEAAVEQLGGDNDVDLTNLFELLADRYTDPIDLNHTTAQELNALLLLNDVQVSALMQHIKRNGKLLSLYELQAINGWDAATIQLVRPFITVRENQMGARASLKEILKQGSHEWTTRSTMNIESRRGFLDRRNSFGKDYADPSGNALPDADDHEVRDSLRANSKVYLGSPYRLYTRYRFRYRQNISIGFTAEKDEGEEFFQGSQRSFDFISAHLFVRDLGRLKSVAIGDYSAQFGQGLTFWNGLAFAAKSSFTLNVKRNAVVLAPYTSVNENLFMRGAAATFAVTRKLELTGFFSTKRIDANVSAQPTGTDTLDTNIQEVIFSSFQEDGFHRTANELLKKESIGERIMGGHLRWKERSWSIGATAARIEYDAVLARSAQPYNQFEFQGRSNTTMGVDWNVLWRNITWFGEAARSANGGVAMNSGLLAALDQRVSMSLLWRDYGRDFHGLQSVGFAEGTNPWNERGLYTGIELRPNRQWQINAYFDQFRFPWLRYLTDGPSSGFDWMAQVNWRPSRKVELYARVRHQDRARNTSADVRGIDPLVRMEQTNYRVNVSAKVSNSITLRTRVETVDFQRGSAPLQHGFLLYQDLVHRPLKSPVELTARFALFESDSYDARLYAFENDLIGVFAIPAYYGRGIRWYGMARITPLRRVDVWVRYGAWIYRDQTSISSGLQEINGNVRSDLKVQVRWLF